MPTKLKHLEIRPRKTGPAAHFVRIGGRGPSVKLEAEPGTSDYFAQYADALNALKNGAHMPDKRKAANNHLLRDIITAFMDSPAMKALKPSSQKTYRNSLKMITARLGDRLFKDITRKHIIEAIEDLAPHTANSFLSTLRRIIHWAHMRELVKSDPTIGIKGPKRDRTGFPPWRKEDIARFQRAWPLGTRERLAFDLLNYTGLRVSDVIELGPQHVEDGYITKVCNKNGVTVRLPVHKKLQASIDATLTGTTTFLRLERFDRGFEDSNYFGAFFRKACRKAGIHRSGDVRAVSAHGLRKTAAIRAIERGATTNQAMAFQGWNDRTIVDLYANELDRAKIGGELGHMIFPTDT